MLNCNKRSITVNMKSDEGQQIFADLVSRVDILAENFGPGVVERFGFTWERLSDINPQLIYASIKGFGPGKYFNFKAYEVIAQAMGGCMATTGFEHGPPTATGAQIGDSGPASTWLPASWPRSTSARTPAAANESRSRCRTPCSTSAGSNCATTNGCSTDHCRVPQRALHRRGPAIG